MKATVPFDIEAIPSFIRSTDECRKLINNIDKALERTRSRWFWCSQAGEHGDQGLGTLNYLPIEIREAILELVLQYHIEIEIEIIEEGFIKNFPREGLCPYTSLYYESQRLRQRKLRFQAHHSGFMCACSAKAE